MRYATIISFLFIFCFSKLFFSGNKKVSKPEETVDSRLDLSARFAVNKEYTVDSFSQIKAHQPVR